MAGVAILFLGVVLGAFFSWLCTANYYDGRLYQAINKAFAQQGYGEYALDPSSGEIVFLHKPKA